MYLYIFIILLFLTLLLGLMFFVWLTIEKWKNYLRQKLGSQSQVVKTEFGIIEYRIAGKGKPVLAIHGALGGYDQGLWLGKKISQSGYQVISISRPGFLNTPLSSGKTHKQQAKLILSLMTLLKIKSFSVFAGSGGGPVALEIAKQEPKKVKTLILGSAVTIKLLSPKKLIINPVGKIFLLSQILDFNSWWLTQLAQYWPAHAAKLIFLGDTKASTNMINNQVKEMRKNQDQVEWLQEFVYSTVPFSLRKEGSLNDLEQITQIKNNLLDNIKIPTLIIHGQADRIVPVDHALAAHRKIKNSILHLVPNCGHIVGFANRGQETSDILLDFLHKNT